MGHLDNNRTFVSDLTRDELKECHRRAMWLAENKFTANFIQSFDLGNLSVGYMTAEITTSYAQGQRRLWYYIDNRLVFTERIEAGQGLRRHAEDYYAMCLKVERDREKERSRLMSARVTA